MTSTSKSAHLRGVAAGTGGNLIKAAKIFGTGSAGVGLQVATRGYALARREADALKARQVAEQTGTDLIVVRSGQVVRVPPQRKTIS